MIMNTPYIFGFSVLTSAMESAVSLSRQLKKLYPSCYIMFGGIHPTAVPDEVLAYKHIDIVVRGEGEKPIVEFYNAIKNNKDHTQIEGISYKKDGKIIHNVRSLTPINLNTDILFPYYLFTNKKYDLGYVTSSRGCPYDCIFCSNRIATGKNYRYRPSTSIVSELKTLYYDHGITEVGFYDDNFLVNKSRIYELIHQIKKSGLHKHMTFSFQARADNVNAALLQDLYNVGFHSIFFGIETASPSMMKTIKKGETVEQCIVAVQLAKKIGYHVSATFIYALPTDTHSTRMGCIELANALDLDLVRFNNATPYPGTELYDIAKKEKRLNIVDNYTNFSAVSTFIESPLHPTPFAYVPECNTEAKIRRDILYSYFAFYLNLNRLKSVFDKSEANAGWFSIGKDALAFIKNVPALSFLFLTLSTKFIQLFYYCTLKPSTRISLKFFLSIFTGKIP